MIEPFGIDGCLIGNGSRRHIAFAPDNGFDAGLGPLLIKLHHIEHGAVVGNGHGAHVEFRGAFEQLIDADGAIQQAVHRMHMKMDKISRCHAHIYFRKVMAWVNGQLSTMALLIRALPGSWGLPW